MVVLQILGVAAALFLALDIYYGSLLHKEAPLPRRMKVPDTPAELFPEEDR